MHDFVFAVPCSPPFRNQNLHPLIIFTVIGLDITIYCPSVPVGGIATISYDYDVGDNYAVIGLRLYCQAAKGSHPRYQWFLNEMLLHNQDSFYVVDQLPDRSILLLSVGWGSAGTYHCEVSDTFDNTTVIRSKKLYIDGEGKVSLSTPPS